MSPNERPTVSLVVPAYNAESTLREAYESVAAQEGVSWEMIIIDNNSSDGTGDVAAEIAADDHRVRIVVEPRQGVFHARNRGIDEAVGDYIAFFDSDDIMGPNALINRVRAIEEDPQCSLSYCPAEYVGPNLEPLDWVYDNRKVVTYEHAYGNPCAVGSALLGKADAIREVRFPPRTHGEDWLYLARLLRAGHRMARAADCRVLYRQSADSAVHSKILNHERSCMEVLDIIYGPDPEVTSAPEWVDGLNSPSLARTKGRRLLRLLAYTLMAEEHEDANLALGMLEAIPYMAPSKAEVDAALTVSVARARHVPINQVKQQWYATLMTIARTARAIKLDERFPAFATVLDGEVATLIGDRWLPGHVPDAAESLVAADSDDPTQLAVELFADTSEPRVAVVVRAPDPAPVLRLAQAGWTVYVFEPGESRRTQLYEQLRSGMRVKVDLRRPQAGADWTDPAHVVDLGCYLDTVGVDHINLLMVTEAGEPGEAANCIEQLKTGPSVVMSSMKGPVTGSASAPAATAAALELHGYMSLLAGWLDDEPVGQIVVATSQDDIADRLLEIAESARSGLSLHRLG
jgi:GT2 family glycosyltransferase